MIKNRKHFGMLVMPKGHKRGGKEASEAKQKTASRIWHSKTQKERSSPLESEEPSSFFLSKSQDPAILQGLLHPYSPALTQVTGMPPSLAEGCLVSQSCHGHQWGRYKVWFLDTRVTWTH